jgi:hypothetical protein
MGEEGALQQQSEERAWICPREAIVGDAREGEMIHRRVFGRTGDLESKRTRDRTGRICRRQSSARRQVSASSSPSRPKARRTVFVSIPKMTTFISNRRIKVL